MTHLHALHFLSLHNAAHYEFFSVVSGALSTAGTAVQDALAAQTPEFHEWFEKEHALMQWVYRSAFTGQIAAASRQVNRALTGIGATVRAARYASDKPTAGAARNLRIMLRNYGRVTHKPYDEKSGDILALLEQFAGTYAADAALVGLTAWIQELQAAFETFDNLLHLRSAERMKKPDCTFPAVRRGIEGVYHRMARLVNAGGALGLSPDFADFIHTLNASIDRFRAEFARHRQSLTAGHTVIEPIDTQQYTGTAITPIPVVHYCVEGKPGVTLTFAKDFTVTYKNNVKEGMAKLTVHGKGAYKGAKSTTFIIVISD